MAKTAAGKRSGKIKEYLKGVRIEFKKVIWPTKKETYRYTLVVGGVCAVFALLFWFLDTGFLFILQQVLRISM